MFCRKDIVRIVNETQVLVSRLVVISEYLFGTEVVRGLLKRINKVAREKVLAILIAVNARVDQNVSKWRSSVANIAGLIE